MDETGISLVGAGNDCCHGTLITARGGCKQRQSSQWDVILATGQTVAIVAVGAESRKDELKGTSRHNLKHRHVFVESYETTSHV